jgi:hypothetical protein
MELRGLLSIPYGFSQHTEMASLSWLYCSRALRSRIRVRERFSPSAVGFYFLSLRAGLLMELVALNGSHPMAFLAFALVGVPLVGAGILVFLYSLVSVKE